MIKGDIEKQKFDEWWLTFTKLRSSQDRWRGNHEAKMGWKAGIRWFEEQIQKQLNK